MDRWSQGNTTYGRFWIDGRTEAAHRLAYKFTYGAITQPMILHSCDNPPCCNPAHLRQGTGLDNSRDMVERGRWNGNLVPPTAVLKRALTHCKHGHEFTPENTHIRPNGTRRCRACDRALHNARYAKTHARAVA